MFRLFSVTALLLSFVLSVFTLPVDPSQIAFNDPLSTTIEPEDLSSSGTSLFSASFLSCPSFKVRCVRGSWPSGIVGDIGPRPFKRVGIRCNQAHINKNTRICNEWFYDECEGQCEAYGPIPF